MSRAIAALFVLRAMSGLAHAQPVDPASEIRLSIRVASSQTTFRVGETIPLELSFSSSVAQKYQLNTATSDRSGRMNYESFIVDPRAGWKDPLDLYFRSGGASGGGGVSSSAPLSPQPIVLPLDLNEWVRFDQPGTYRLTIQSHRASLVAQPARSVPVVSNDLSLTIVAASPEWQQETLQKTLAALNDTASHASAAKTLRYLGTEAAVRAMAHCRQDPDCWLGLVGSPFRAAGLDEMRKLLRDPDTPVDRPLLDALTFLAIPDAPGQHFQDRNVLVERFQQELVAALPQKKGAALAASVRTAMENPRGLDAETRQMLTDVLVANFDDLPMAMQSELINNRFGPLDRMFLVPMLRKMAGRYQEFPQPQSPEAMEFNRVAGDALVRWYTLAPADARPAVIREILRPTPRFSIDVLGILPDKELPEVNQAVVSHFESTSDRVAARNLAMLIGRYGTAASETELAARLDRDVSAGLCETQSPLLAWLLRVDPEQARLRLDDARRTGARCRLSLSEIGRLQPGPIVEALAVQALDDPDAVPDAGAYLGDYGAATAEDALWSHYAAWSKRWIDHEAELNPYGADARAGQSMMQALLTAQAWVMSDSKLRRLADLAVGATMRQQATQYVRMWQQRPWLVRSSATGQFLILWYRAVSMRAAKEKLLQFPKGTEFRWILQGLPNDPADLHELAEFAMNQGLRLW